MGKNSVATDPTETAETKRALIVFRTTTKQRRYLRAVCLMQGLTLQDGMEQLVAEKIALWEEITQTVTQREAERAMTS